MLLTKQEKKSPQSRFGKYFQIFYQKWIIDGEIRHQKCEVKSMRRLRIIFSLNTKKYIQIYSIHFWAQGYEFKTAIRLFVCPCVCFFVHRIYASLWNFRIDSYLFLDLNLSCWFFFFIFWLSSPFAYSLLTVWNGQILCEIKRKRQQREIEWKRIKQKSPHKMHPWNEICFSFHASVNVWVTGKGERVFVAVGFHFATVLCLCTNIYIIKSMLGQKVKRRVTHHTYSRFKYLSTDVDGNSEDDDKRMQFHTISHAMQTYHVWYLQINERTNEQMKRVQHTTYRYKD